MAEVFDRAYFDRWYRDPAWSVVSPSVLDRRVRLALATAEYLLERPVRSVLDVGCGEAPWRARLMRARPGLAYTGVDSSTWVVRRHGRRRNILLGDVGALERLRLRPPYDLIVCSDVLHYVDDRVARACLASVARLLGGLAFIEVFTKEDATEGDVAGMRRRPATVYRRMFREAGLSKVGPHGYVGHALEGSLVSFERG